MISSLMSSDTVRNNLIKAFVCGIAVGLTCALPLFYYTSVICKRRLRSTIPLSCPGLLSSKAGKAEPCEGCPNQVLCLSGQAKSAAVSNIHDVKINLETIKTKVLVLSGKGGVGKSTISAQLAWMFSNMNYKVGLLDIDICGPSIPLLTGTKRKDVHRSMDGWSPISVNENLSVMSIEYLLPDEDNAVIWRGPKKDGLIKQFLSDVNWGKQDLLIVDTPPGTSDEHLSIVTYLKDTGIDGAIIVTTPQEVALQDVRREINFCKKIGVPVLGLVENMSNSVFDEWNSNYLALNTCRDMDIPYFGKIPLSGDLVNACDTGSFLNPLSEVFYNFKELADSLARKLNLKQST